MNDADREVLCRRRSEVLLLLEEPAVDANSIDNATPIHKLFHAATEADCPSSVPKQWIDESHAAAVET